jgi:cobalamin-dependent methionine synthase I
MSILSEFKLQLDNAEILQLLISNKARKKPMKEVPDYLLNEIESLKEDALELISPIAIYDYFDSQNLKPKFLFKKSEQTLFTVCTIGQALEVESEKLMNNNSLSKGLILDAIASHATEVLAEKLNQLLSKEIKEKFEGKNYSNRFSPGYCQWTIENGQKLIFKLLPVEKINVQLTRSYMMIPRKSISFAINIGNEIEEWLGIRECETCDITNCSHRRV